VKTLQLGGTGGRELAALPKEKVGKGVAVLL